MDICAYAIEFTEQLIIFENEHLEKKCQYIY